MRGVLDVVYAPVIGNISTRGWFGIICGEKAKMECTLGKGGDKYREYQAPSNKKKTKTRKERDPRQRPRGYNAQVLNFVCQACWASTILSLPG